MKYRVTLGEKIYEVEVEQGSATLLDEYEAASPAPTAPAEKTAAPAVAQPSGAALASGEVVKAPMPGNILHIKVTQGQTVKAGAILVILEAMKMENEIVAPRDGTVVQIVTTQGAVVETGAPLLILA